MTKYRVLIGLNYPPNDKRAEPGDLVDDIPAGSVGWLLKDGIIEPADTKHDDEPAKEEG